MKRSPTSQWSCSAQPAASHGAVRQGRLFPRGTRGREGACFPPGRRRPSEEPQRAGPGGRAQGTAWYAGFGLAGGLCWAGMPNHLDSSPITEMLSARLCEESLALPGATDLLTSPQTAFRTRHPHAATWTHWNVPDFETSETRKGTSLALSDARSQGNSSGPVHVRSWLATQRAWSQTQPYHYATGGFALSGQGKFSRLIENILRMEKKVLRKYLLLA